VVTPKNEETMEVILRSIDGNTNKVSLDIHNWTTGPGCPCP
jgi:hypothetical protein